MAWMIVYQEVNWARPKSMLSFNAKAKPEPQQFPEDFVAYAVDLGRAKRARPPSRQAAKAAKDSNSAA